MRPFNKITVFENYNRLTELIEFRTLVIDYFNNSRLEEFSLSYERKEDQIAQEARGKINRKLDELHDIVLLAGINPTLFYSPPPAIGGYCHDIDLIHNIFNLGKFSIAPNIVIDIIDRAIGIYENNRWKAFRRTLNPFFYFGLIINWVATLPFVLLGTLGFDRKKAETSFLGRIVKGITYLVSLIASILTILSFFGYSDIIKNFFINIID